MMDCRQIAGHWIAITLSVILFNIGIALASFATSFGSQGWRIVGVTILGIGFLMIITIPLLIRRSIHNRLREAFRSLPEAELRRKRCSGHYIAWVLSAIHFILGIALTSYAADINSKGWTIVGLILVVIGLVSMVVTSIFIHVNMRERKSNSKIVHYQEQQNNNLVSKDTTKAPFSETNGVDNNNILLPNGIDITKDENTGNICLAIEPPTSEEAGNICLAIEPPTSEEADYIPLSIELSPTQVTRDRRSQSAPDIFGNITDIIDRPHDCTGSTKRLATSLSDISESTIIAIKKEQIEQLSRMMDHDVPNWKSFGHKVAINHRHKLRRYKEFLNKIDDCRICNVGENNIADRVFTYLQNKEPKLHVRSFLEDAEKHRREDIIDFINTNNILKTENGEDMYLSDISNSDKEALVKMMDKHVKNNWSSIAESFNVTYIDITDTQVDSPSSNHLSPTSTLFDLLKLELPNLTLKEIYYALKEIGRNDVANYLEEVFFIGLTEVVVT